MEMELKINTPAKIKPFDSNRLAKDNFILELIDSSRGKI